MEFLQMRQKGIFRECCFKGYDSTENIVIGSLEF